MKKRTIFTFFCILLVLSGCRKGLEQAEHCLPKPEPPAAEETTAESEEEPEESTIEDSTEKWDKPDKHHEKGPGKPEHKPRKDASGPKPPKR